ncbi:MAG: hypothetical protein BIFFINMI_00405 [Phycisphaerae bacterium]|nr:hypothetical protein [Phycisphaerae bacterium]
MAEPKKRTGREDESFARRQVKIFLAGATVVVPFAITIATLVLTGAWIGGLVNKVLPEGRDLPLILGLLLVLAAIYAVGLLTRLFLFKSLVRLGEWALAKVPLIYSLYEGIRDLLKFFGGGDKEQMGRVVKVTLAGGQIRMLGILTNERPRGLIGEHRGSPAILESNPDAGRVAVYLPMSYQLGGFTIYVDPSQVQDVDMTVEQAMKISATADVG